MINVDPFKRIGVKDKSEIKKHPFFDGLNFDRLLRKEYDPPFDFSEINEELLKPDKNLKFVDRSHLHEQQNINRIPEFSFQEDVLEKSENK